MNRSATCRDMAGIRRQPRPDHLILTVAFKHIMECGLGFRSMEQVAWYFALAPSRRRIFDVAALAIVRDAMVANYFVFILSLRWTKEVDDHFNSILRAHEDAIELSRKISAGLAVRLADDVAWMALPKWPHMIVTGERVTVRQAAEICIRTCEPHHVFSNDRAFRKAVLAVFDAPAPYESNGDLHGYLSREQNFSRRMKLVELEYLRNSRIASCYIGGPHGWCNWNGRIFSNSYSIGKWPDIQAVADEWARIATAFPFLDLTCWLFSEGDENGEMKALVLFRIKNGRVGVMANPPEPNMEGLEDEPYACVVADERLEHGIEVDELKAKVIEIYGENYPRYSDPLPIEVERA